MAEGFAWPPRQQVELGTARPRQQPAVALSTRKTEEPSRFNLWRLGLYSIRRQQVEPGTARPSIRRESCGFADFGRFNLWRPTVVDRTRGSKWVQALPARPGKILRRG